ncbi:MAG: tetratricopeptide repeat protein [Verrucomicrobia bacterium]|nr:tetratricopeptide repeat protein [Verrucomicrobiota bacterium]
MVLAIFSTTAAWAFAHAQVGSTIDNVEMPTLAGGKQFLLSNASANVFVFFKPGQEHSRTTLTQIAASAKDMATQSVHWVAIVSDRFLTPEVEALVQETGLTMPVLIDAGDTLYGKLGVALTPVAGITDKDHKLVAYQPFSKVNYVEVVRARVRHLLKEITDEQLQAVLQPPAATQGGAASVARRYLKLAEKLLQAKNHGKALESVRKSLENDPALAAAHTLLGQILLAQDKPDDARKAFARALELDPNDAKASEGLKATSPSTK